MFDEIPVLDKGFVRLVDQMGNDMSVVQAARVSYAQEPKGDERDVKLIRYLMSHDHGTPFEMLVFKFHVKCPIFVMRQWIRHRMASYNEVSGRYVELPEEFYIPSRFRSSHLTNKQGSVPSELIKHDEMSDLVEKATKHAYNTYLQLIENGVAKEMARIVLPLSVYTQFYVTLNARSLMNFIRLRIDPHAQFEIQVYAQALLQLFEQGAPITAQAFRELQLNLPEAN